MTGQPDTPWFSLARNREDRLQDASAQQRQCLVVHNALTTVQPTGAVPPKAQGHFAVSCMHPGAPSAGHQGCKRRPAGW